MNKHFFYVSKKNKNLLIKSLLLIKALFVLILAFSSNDYSFKETFQSIEENIKETILGQEDQWKMDFISMDDTLNHFENLSNVKSKKYI